MSHQASSRFWRHFESLPVEVQRLARENYELLKTNPRHPSLQFKRVGKLWSVRVGLTLMRPTCRCSRPGAVRWLAGRAAWISHRFATSVMLAHIVSRLLVRSFSISIDGYGAGPGQDLENPLGVGGPELFDWFFHTRTWQRMHGNADGETGIDDDLATQGMEGIGAWILGRNMFGPVRGSWPDDTWKGWWGDEPPYHTPVFVLTHYPRAPFAMKGGTEFRFVTDGIEAALEQAKAAAGGKDVRLGGGVSTIRQYLRAALIDELHLAISPVLLGSGEHLLAGINMRALGYECVNHMPGARAAAHVILRKRG